MRASCVICSDLFDGINTIVAGPCGHAFHEDCIIKWFDRSRTCPECRNHLTTKGLTRLFFNIVPSEVSSDYLENRISDLEARINERNIEICKERSEKEEIRAYVRIAEEKVQERDQEVYRLKSELTSMRLDINDLRKRVKKGDELEIQNKTLMNKLELFQNIQTVIEGTRKDVDDMLQGIINGPNAMKDIATHCSLLKRDLLNASEAKQQLKDEIAYLRQTNASLSFSKKQLSDENRRIKEQVQSLEKENSFLLAKQASSASVTTKESNKATVSYESPAPERLKDSSEENEDEVIVTPVSQRLNPSTMKRSKSFSYKMCISFPVGTCKKPRADIHADLNTIVNNQKSTENNNRNSTIRNGYNGMGGHSKFILQTQDTNFKQRLKRK